MLVYLSQEIQQNNIYAFWGHGVDGLYVVVLKINKTKFYNVVHHFNLSSSLLCLEEIYNTALFGKCTDTDDISK